MEEKYSKYAVIKHCGLIWTKPFYISDDEVT